jgi:TldD protein
MAALRPRLADAISVLAQRSPYAAVLLSAREGISITVEAREEQINQMPRSAGAVLSSFDGATLSEKSVPGFDADRLQAAAASLAASLPNGSRAGAGTVEAVVPRDFATTGAVPPESLPLEDKLERCRDLQRRLAAADPRIVNARVSYLEFDESSVYRSREADLAQRVVRVRLSVFAVLSQGGETRYDWQSKGTTGDWQPLAYSDADLKGVVEGAARLFTAERIEPGEYTVLSGPGVSGVLCHESFGHGVETDLFPKERARAFDYIGRQVGSPLVGIVDDPSLAGGYSSYFFDDEGMLSRPALIVEGGIFRGGISDMASAQRLGIERTANGRRQDYTRKPYARMSNTYFAAGPASVEDMLAQVDRGIYLDQWVNGMEDPMGWGIQITCHYGQEIRNGVITDRTFSPVSISGYVPEVLGTIRAASSTVVMDQGTCGKGHKEYVPNSSGGPHLLLSATLG